VVADPGDGGPWGGRPWGWRIRTVSAQSNDELGTVTSPIPFWRIVVKARNDMEEEGVTVAQVLRHLLQFTASVRLDERLSHCIDSDEWLRVKATAGGTSLFVLNWFS